MLRSKDFWVGVIVGLALCLAYSHYQSKGKGGA